MFTSREYQGERTVCDEKERGRDEKPERPTFSGKKKKIARQNTHAELVGLEFEFIALLEAITNCLTWHIFTQSSLYKSLITILAVIQIRLTGHWVHRRGHQSSEERGKRRFKALSRHTLQAESKSLCLSVLCFGSV